MSSDWKLTYQGYDPAQQPLREALCTVGNGYFATRGAFEEVRAGGPHYPGTYLAGGYDRATTKIAGREVENEDLVNWPNWIRLSFRPDEEDGEWLDLDAFQVLEFEQSLELDRGLLCRRMRVRDSAGRETTLQSRRFAHMHRANLGAVEWSLTPLNWSGGVVVRSEIDGEVTNRGVARYGDLTSEHHRVVDGGLVGEEGVWLMTQARQSKLTVAQAIRTEVLDETGRCASCRRHTYREGGRAGQEIRFEVAQETTTRIEKIAAIHSSRDHAISEPGDAARTAALEAPRFSKLLATHVLAWEGLWRRCDIRIEGRDSAQLILRFHVFHLLQTVGPESIDLDAGVPARGLHGEAYRGHIFWDELFVFPFLNFTVPVLTRSLLMYRYRRLPAARRLAREAGLKGAMYPWQSGSDGREESQVTHLNPRSGRWLPDETHLQRHISSAVAYNIWHYYQATEDIEFLSAYGAEMLLEIARFWASIATYSEEKGRYEILGVVGPDEYHVRYPGRESPGLDNNAYTNVMAVWVILRALAVLEVLSPTRRDELMRLLAIADDEVERWRDVASKMYVPFLSNGLIEQFDGYELLRELDWAGLKDRYGDIQRLDRILESEGLSPDRYKASKQADVLMLFYLFSSDELVELLSTMGYVFDPQTIPEHVDYYMDRTSHGSTLSRLVHAWVLARRDRPRSWQLFEDALRSDVEDIQGGTTHEGIHLGAMAGTIDMVQRGHVGIEVRGGVLWLNPELPEDIDCVSFSLRYRSHWLDLVVKHDTLEVAFRVGREPTVQVGVVHDVYRFAQGERRIFDIRREKA